MNSSKLARIVVVSLFSVVLWIGTSFAADVVKIGVVGAKTGPQAGGAAVTHFPNIKLWVTEVNNRGGLKLKDGRKKIEVIEYDDRTNPGEAIQAVQRLATQDKVDFIISPYSTGLTLAVAPIFDKYGYPQIATTSVTDHIQELTKRYPNIFFTLGQTTEFVNSVVKILTKMRKDGTIGNKVAMVNVADAFGIELANAARPLFKKAGFNIVYDTSYPLGTQDLTPVINGAKGSKPDAFVAWSYPPDTFGLTEQARISGLNLKVFYTAVGACFPSYLGKFGKSAEGVLGVGGVNPNTSEMKAYRKAHKEITGADADFWASPVVYSSLQVLEQAIEAVGSVDKKAVSDYIKKGTFKTVMGKWQFKDRVIRKYWTVGQWQNNVFYGVESTGMQGAKQVQLKPAW